MPFRPQSYFYANGDLIDLGPPKTIESIDELDPLVQRQRDTIRKTPPPRPPSPRKVLFYAFR